MMLTYSAKNIRARWRKRAAACLVAFALLPAAAPSGLAPLVRAYRASPNLARRAAIEAYAKAHPSEEPFARLALGIAAYEQKDYAGAVSALAGLAESWIGPNGEELDTVAIVTAPASRDLAVLHSRVPVAIRNEDFQRWLDCSADDAAPVMELLAPPEAGEFAWHEVSRRVNHVDNDDPQLILPVTDEQRLATEAPKSAKRAIPRKVRPPAIDDGQGSLF